MKFRPHRYRTEFPVVISTPMGQAKTVINDVNETGALMTTNAPLARGHKIEISVLNQHIRGVVQWSAAGRCGVAFRPHLTINQVDSLRYRQAGRRTGHHHASGYAEMR